MHIRDVGLHTELVLEIIEEYQAEQRNWSSNTRMAGSQRHDGMLRRERFHWRPLKEGEYKLNMML